MKRLPAIHALLWSCSVALSAACGGGLGGSSQPLTPPKIELSPDKDLYEIEEGQYLVGEEWCQEIRILNTGGQDLTLLEPPALVEAPCPGQPEGTSTFRLGLPASWTGGQLKLKATGKTGEGIPLKVCWKRPEASCAWSATLTIKSDDPLPENRTKTVHFQVNTSSANIESQDVDFGVVTPGSRAEDELCVTNSGLGSLYVTEVRCSGSEGFTIVWPCERGSGGGEIDKPIAIDSKGFVLETCDTPEKEKALGGKCCKTPLEIAKNQSECVTVTHSPVCDNDGVCPPPAEATCRFVSNDPEYDATKHEGLDVKLTANIGGKCLMASPSVVDFGSVVVQTTKPKPVDLVACGDEAVTITGLVLSPATDAKLFDLDKGELAKLPITLNPGQKKTFKVTYKPEEAHKDPVSGQYQPDLGAVVVSSDALLPEMEIPLNGTPINSDAPSCVIRAYEWVGAQKEPVKDGDKVEIQANIEMDWKSSYDPAGGKLTCEWSSKPPPGDASTFSPSPYFDQVQYPVNVVGSYDFCLSCSNPFGASCDACIRLIVEPPKGCHVELTWTTPADPDQTDDCHECGADMDLHVVHDYATGPDRDKDGQPDGFFDLDFDTYWMNANPSDARWCPHQDPVDPLCLPHLDLDDTNGGGPENFTYVIPDPERCYKVGVHYWDDHQFGASYPTVKVWVDGDLLYTNATPPKMKMLDMWEVGKVCCVARTFQEFKAQNGGPLVVGGYLPPDIIGPP